MKITTHTNLDQFISHLTDLEKKQIPFATSRALNDVAKQMQAKVIDKTEANFDNRKKWYRAGSPIGIKVHRSTKQDLTAGIYTKAHFGALQEDGGIKSATQSHNLAIPLQDIPKKYRNNKPGLSGARRAMQEKGKRGAFIAIGKSGKLGMYRRKTKKRYPLKLLFRLQPSAKIQKRWGFKDAAEREARQRFVSAFHQRLIEAIASMR